MLTLEYKKNIGHGEDNWGKPLAFPEATRFSELFEEWRWWIHERSLRFEENRGVSDYCAAHRTDLEDSIHVKAKGHVVEWIVDHMILPEYDSWFFEITQRKDGILVLVKNNAIIASRWLALLDGNRTLEEIRSAAKTVYRPGKELVR